MLAWLRLATSSSARFGAASPTQLCERFRTHQAATGPAGNQTQEAGVEKPHAAGDRGRHRNAGDRAVPATLKKDGRSHPPHLRTWRDGWRHLRFFLIFSPRCLFFYPGLALLILGIAISILLLPGPVYITLYISLDIHTFLVSAVTVLIGMQCLLCSRGPSLRRRPRTRRIADRQAGCIVKREAREVQLLGSITHDGCRKRVRTDAKLRPDQAGSSGLLAVFLANAGSDGIAYRSAMKNAAH